MSKILFKSISLWVQIRDLFWYLFRQVIIVNAWIDDHTWRGIHHRNWGDDINYYFIRELTHRPVVTIYNFRLARRFKFKNYLCIGSLLGMPDYTNEKTIVWGAGSLGEIKGVSPRKICAVRGKLTRNIILERGIECPEVYGDPALLLPRFYRPNFRRERREGRLRGGEQSEGWKELRKYRMGIIPHVIDLKHPVVEEIRKEHPEILIIDLEHYKKWTDVIDQICSCECILSSSLHGLIVSDAYGIPNCWIKLSGKILGGYFKYQDYASSVGRELVEPLQISSFSDIEKTAIDILKSSPKQSSVYLANQNKIKQIQDDLLRVAPFKIKI